MITYNPGNVPDDPKLLPEFLRQELLSMLQAMQRAEPFIRLTPTTKAPTKVQDGDVYEAKGPWDPGSGDGLYVMRAGSWVFIG